MKNEEDLKTNDEEMGRKRKSSSSSTNQDQYHQIDREYQIPKRVHQNLDENDNDFLALRLRTISEQELSSLSSSPIQQPSLSSSTMQKFILPQQQVQIPVELSPQHSLYLPTSFMHEPLPLPVYRAAATEPPVSGGVSGVSVVSRPLRARRNPTQSPGQGKSETVPALFPWATTARAIVHPLNYLLSRHITAIKGEVQCKKCDKQYEMEYDLKDKFMEVGRFIAENKNRMHDRAPSVWMNPVLPACRFCEQENSAKPVIPEKKKEINWLFLLLGQLLGCCTLEQLKYFCKHTKNHRTGAKDRVLYLTYLGLCKQLDPTGPFDR
ncbi:hypothetical protein ACOSP7_005498 [Xanthoceras sorbifolium]